MTLEELEVPFHMRKATWKFWKFLGVQKAPRGRAIDENPGPELVWKVTESLICCLPSDLG